jgi:hypothetical protein
MCLCFCKCGLRALGNLGQWVLKDVEKQSRVSSLSTLSSEVLFIYILNMYIVFFLCLLSYLDSNLIYTTNKVYCFDSLSVHFFEV